MATADQPQRLPGRALPRTLWRTVREFRQDNLTDWAAAMTYYAVLSIFPALIALVSIVGLVMDPQRLTDALVKFVDALGPSSAVDTFRGPIHELAHSRGTAGVLLVVGIVGALWTASGWVGAFMRASNQIYESPEGRPFWKLRPLQVAVTLALVLLLALVLVAVVVTGPVAGDLGDAIGVGGTVVTVWGIVKWPVLMLIVLAMFAILYHAAPNARLPRFRWVTAGSVVGVAVWLVATAGFALYVAHFGSYSRVYGTLGGVVTFLVWMWISNLAILFGQELNAELERTRELAAGTHGAERELQLPPRDPPPERHRPRPA